MHGRVGSVVVVVVAVVVVVVVVEISELLLHNNRKAIKHVAVYCVSAMKLAHYPPRFSDAEIAWQISDSLAGQCGGRPAIR